MVCELVTRNPEVNKSTRSIEACAFRRLQQEAQNELPTMWIVEVDRDRDETSLERRCYFPFMPFMRTQMVGTRRRRLFRERQSRRGSRSCQSESHGLVVTAVGRTASLRLSPHESEIANRPDRTPSGLGAAFLSRVGVEDESCRRPNPGGRVDSMLIPPS